MPAQILSSYYVGQGQPYQDVDQVLNTIANALATDDYTLPPDSLSDGGQVNIVIVGNKKLPNFTIPDNMTLPLADAGRYLVIKRQEYRDDGMLISSSLPTIGPIAPTDATPSIEDHLIGIRIGNNNPNVKLIGLRVDGFVIGVTAGFNCNNLTITRCFLTNSINTQLYVHDSTRVYIVNNVIVGGQYGIVLKNVGGIRVYHNTVFLDGLTAIDGTTKAGMILQGERLFGASTNAELFCLANLVYTVGCPAVIFYEEDIGALNSNYNDFYSSTALVQLRQDNATLPEDVSEIIRNNYTDLTQWRQVAPLSDDTSRRVDQDSISTHPIFIQNIGLAGSTSSSIINLSLINNSPLTQKVPSWFHTTDNFYIPTDLDTDLISIDSLNNSRQYPYTSIGANDAQSLNGFFGQDIFTSPLEIDPEKKCDVDPLNLVSSQELTMTYPAIMAGYFYSHERPYYLYGKKAGVHLGYLAKTSFTLPGILYADTVTVSVRDEPIQDQDWDIIGKKLVLYHKGNKITSYEDEVQIAGKIKGWFGNGFTSQDVFYIFKIKDGTTEFVLPDNYQPGAPIVITDDRVSYRNPIDAVRREFSTVFDENAQETKIVFGGNDNLFENSDFSYTFSGSTPSYWIASPQSSDPNVFLLWNDYSYFGDYALGIKIDHNPGYIISPLIDIAHDDALCLSWHAKLPLDITGQTGNSITSASGFYKVTLYDNYNEQMPDLIEGYFDITTGYHRYYLPIGADDDVIDTTNDGYLSAPLIAIQTGVVVLPERVTKFELTLSGVNMSGQVNSGSFMILDAIQAEYESSPSYYHPSPSFYGMTVEFETSASGVFTDRMLNISPVFNENPNGFLCIADMPASLWGGPKDPETTTLHEYRWPDGRFKILPWARLFGKDKLRQKSILGNDPSVVQDIINPYAMPRAAYEASITPSVIRISQNAEYPDGFNVQVSDTLGNPYSLRGFVAHTYDPNGHFPGWLSKSFMGAKEQLGSTVYGNLNSNGSFNGYYLSPSQNHIKWVGTVPTVESTATGLSGVLDSVSFIKVPYSVSSENNGNITIIGEGGKFHDTYSRVPISGQYLAEAGSNSKFIALEYPPVYGTVKLYMDGIQFSETYMTPQENEFSVSYSYGQVFLANNTVVGTPVVVSYQPKYAYPIPDESNKIILHNNKIFNGYSGPIQVDYDAEIKLEVRVSDSLNREFVATFPVIAQNPLIAYSDNHSLEYEF